MHTITAISGASAPTGEVRIDIDPGLQDVPPSPEGFHSPDLRVRQQLLDQAVRDCDPDQVRDLARRLSGARDPSRGDASVVEMEWLPDAYLRDGDLGALPDALRGPVGQALAGATAQTGISGRLMALLAVLQDTHGRLDDSALGRSVINFAHTTLRSLGSVGLTTMARQAVGRAVDLATTQGCSELARTLIGAGMMALPVVGQAVLLARDEMQGDATHYSRATRVVLMGLSVGVGGLALGTGTLTNPGLRMAEVVLYPLLRDSVQALFPIASDPESGPTGRSLAVAGVSYAANQLGVSRAFAAAPDVGDHGVIATGVMVRSLANAAGESVDLMSLLYANHISRHGTATAPRLRITRGELGEALRTPLHWDTMFARGCFVSAFNQLYDTLLADNTLARALKDVVGHDRAAVAADWLTEGIAFGMTALTYPFWTDPVHARGFVLPEQRMEEGRIGREAEPPVQYAGNLAEPAVAGNDDGVTLVSYIDERSPHRGTRTSIATDVAYATNAGSAPLDRRSARAAEGTGVTRL